MKLFSSSSKFLYTVITMKRIANIFCSITTNTSIWIRWCQSRFMSHSINDENWFQPNQSRAYMLCHAQLKSTFTTSEMFSFWAMRKSKSAKNKTFRKNLLPFKKNSISEKQISISFGLKCKIPMKYEKWIFISTWFLY